MPPQSPPMDDHDLLVRLDTKLDALSASFAEVKVSVAGKADVARVDRFESRLDKVEERLDQARLKLYTITGGVVALQAALKWLVR